jgi:hypothetical protein
VQPLVDSNFRPPQQLASPAQYDVNCQGISPARGTP